MIARRNFLTGSLAAGAALAVPAVARSTPADRIEAAKAELLAALCEVHGPGVTLTDNEIRPERIREGSLPRTIIVMARA